MILLYREPRKQGWNYKEVLVMPFVDVTDVVMNEEAIELEAA